MPKINDLKGRRIGRLTVVRKVPGISKYQTWECICDCGKTICADSLQLRKEYITSCGCEQPKKMKRKSGRKAQDLTGMTFGKLTVLEMMPRSGNRVLWKCQCSCGNITTTRGYSLKQGIKNSCGCLKKASVRKLDITNHRYGKLTALYPTDQKSAYGSVVWVCRCDCGNEVKKSVAELNNGNNKSCGCLKEEAQRLVHDRLHLIDGTCVEWLEGRKKRSDNTSGFRGVFQKKNGRYAVSIGFKKKIYYLGTFDNYEDAVEARLKAEKKIHDGFVKAYEMWGRMSAKDQDWAKKNPFYFEVNKVNGEIVITNSMDAFTVGATAEDDEKSDKNHYKDMSENGNNLLRIDALMQNSLYGIEKSNVEFGAEKWGSKEEKYPQKVIIQQKVFQS